MPAVEIRPYTDFDAREVRHQDHARHLVVRPETLLSPQRREQVRPILHDADVRARRCKPGPGELQDVARRVLANERDGLVPTFDLMKRRHAKTGLFEHPLTKSAIELETTAEGASSDHAKSTAAKGILTFPLARPFEDHEAPLPSARDQVVVERVDARHDPEQDVTRIRIGDVYLHVVPARDESPVQVAKVAMGPNTEHTHDEPPASECRKRVHGPGPADDDPPLGHDRARPVVDSPHLIRRDPPSEYDG